MLGMVIYTCNSTTEEAEASLGYIMRSYLQKGDKGKRMWGRRG
jgi:hypothetical protein